MVRWVGASVSILSCSKIGHQVPHITFSSDTDMVTGGLASVSSISKSEIVVGEMTPLELIDETGLLFENRMNAELERDDLRFVRLLRVDRATFPKACRFKNLKIYMLPLVWCLPVPDVWAGKPSKPNPKRSPIMSVRVVSSRYGLTSNYAIEFWATSARAS